jgi:hypothetical protein
MSADNWGVCPRCKANHESGYAKLVQLLDDQYGKIDRVDYKALEAKLADTSEEYSEYHMREDYEFYMDENASFLANYGAHCTSVGCGFKFTFRHEEDVKF